MAAMSSISFPHLFSPFTIGGVTFKNRIFSTGHDTMLAEHELIGDALVAYHAARADGGAGLIVIQVAAIHESARYTGRMLMATDDACIDGYRRIVEVCGKRDCRVIAQLFHPGREVMDTDEGALRVAYAPSATRSDRSPARCRAPRRRAVSPRLASRHGPPCPGSGATSRTIRRLPPPHTCAPPPGSPRA